MELKMNKKKVFSISALIIMLILVAMSLAVPTIMYFTFILMSILIFNLYWQNAKDDIERGLLEQFEALRQGTPPPKMAKKKPQQSPPEPRISNEIKKAINNAFHYMQNDEYSDKEIKAGLKDKFDNKTARFIFQEAERIFYNRR